MSFEFLILGFISGISLMMFNKEFYKRVYFRKGFLSGTKAATEYCKPMMESLTKAHFKKLVDLSPDSNEIRITAALNYDYFFDKTEKETTYTGFIIDELKKKLEGEK